MILFVIGLLIALGFIHIVMMPWMNTRIRNALTEGRNWCNYRITDTIKDGNRSLWAQQAHRLLDAEKEHLNLPIDNTQLKQLTELPGVQDAFYLDFTAHRSLSVNNIIPDTVLISKLDKFGKKGGGGAHFMSRRVIGGLAKFKSIKVNDQSYTVMIRYVGTYYPNRATEAIGMVLDKKWYFDRIPAMLDSLAKNSSNLLWFAYCPPDTFWGDVDDPYAAVNSAWKQTIGVLHKKDTLWWYGDRTMDMGYEPLPGSHVGRWEHKHVDNFGIVIKLKVEFPKFQEEILTGRKKIVLILYSIEFIGIVLIVLLIFSVKQARKQVRRNNLALAHLAHSIKTPIARMRLNTDVLTEERVASPVEENEIVTAIGRECGRLERAVQNASLSLERGKRAFNLEKCDLTQTVQETVEAWQSGFDRVGIRLSIETDNSPMNIEVDREMIAVAIDNLIDNALRHTTLNKDKLADGEAKVTVNLSQEDEKAVISVDDMGGGITKSDRDKIFKPFTRAKDAAGTGVSGLGLGLALVKEIAEGHGGRARIEDSDLRGTRFTVELPL